MSKKIRVAINGFGRIGRSLYRLLLSYSDIEVIAVNDIANLDTLVHLLKYDSIHGRLNKAVSIQNTNQVVIENTRTHFYQYERILDCPWKDLNIDIVVEATGKFKTSLDLKGHLIQGAKKVILSVPPLTNDIKTIVMGVNTYTLDGSERIISNASCTTNNAAPMVKLIDELCGIRQSYITTVHSYTTDQSLHDQPHRDLRRARAATQSIVPTTTGAAKAITKIFPHLKQVTGGCGIRVPVPNGSLTDITFNVERPTTIDVINKYFYNASIGELKGILQYTEDPIVSIDIIGSSYSCIFDSLMTSSIGTMVKIVGWYDNERGYSHRLIDLIRFVLS